MGAGQLLVLDPSARRRELAVRVVGAVALAPGDAAACEMREAAAAKERTLVVNATGFPGTFEQATAMLRGGGTIIEVGAFLDIDGEAFNAAHICGRVLTLISVGGEDLRSYEGTLTLLAPPSANRRRHRLAPVRDRRRVARDEHRARCGRVREGADRSPWLSSGRRVSTVRPDGDCFCRATRSAPSYADRC